MKIAILIAFIACASAMSIYATPAFPYSEMTQLENQFFNNFTFGFVDGVSAEVTNETTVC